MPTAPDDAFDRPQWDEEAHPEHPPGPDGGTDPVTLADAGLTGTPDVSLTTAGMESSEHVPPRDGETGAR